MTDINLWAALGFLFAAYAVVGNDALQTLGTFIHSNGRLHWLVLFAFASTILVVTFAYGWIANDGDPSFGRLDNREKYGLPESGVQWFHVLPPLALVVLTRMAIPVSTSFMVLAVFARSDGLDSMISKSLIGYGLAFAVGLLLYLSIAKVLEGYIKRNPATEHLPRWVILQWVSTAWLWAVWLMQDFANIFVFLPRDLTLGAALTALGVIVVLLAVTFATQGGPVQRILKSKTSVTDLRSATMIDLVFASLLYFFKELSNIPMSTTWVFLGLIAGREYAFAFAGRVQSVARASELALADLAKAFVGLVISVDLARVLPALAGGETLWHSPAAGWFLLAVNLMLIPVALFLSGRKRATSMTMAFTLAAGTFAFFTLPTS